MSSEAVEALLQIHEDKEGEQHKLQSDEPKHVFQNLKLINHISSFDILKHAFKIIQVTPSLHSLCFSLLPFYVFMVFYEIIIPKINDVTSKVLVPPYFSYMYSFNHDDEYSQDLNVPMRNILSIFLELFPLYFVLLPLLEFFSLFMIVNSAQKIYKGEKVESLTLNKGINTIESFYKKDILKGPFIVTLLVQLFSICSLAGLFWTIISHHFTTYWLFSRDYRGIIYPSSLRSDQLNLSISISIVFHLLIFVAILYKYLEWSAFWNMGIVISVLHREVGVYALELSAYYGKHGKHTGFRLMLIFFAYSVAIRVPFLFARMFDDLSVRVIVSGIVSLFVCIGSLVKWVIFVVYYNDCKAKMMAMKVDDEEVGKAMKDGDDLIVRQSSEGSMKT